MNTHTLRRAILLAADHIDLHPKLYQNAASFIPLKRTEPASALGWIAYFAMYRRPDNCASGMALQLADTPHAFNDRMCELDAERGWRTLFTSWRSNARVAARCLRAYANTYHAVPLPAAHASGELEGAR